MGRLIFSAITSLDGHLADADGNFDWGVPDEEALADITAEVRTVGTHLYGRRMYETMTGWETDPATAAQSPESARFAAAWQAADKIVYSTTLPDVVTRRTRLLREFDPAAVAELTRTSETDVYVAGPTLAAHAFRSGIVDRLHLVLCPVVVGGGLPAVPADVRLNLHLTEERRYANGMVGLRYDVLR